MRSAGAHSRLTKNIVANLLGQGLVLLLGFVAVRVIFTRLGADGLGIIYFALTLSAALSAALELGICSTAVREVSARFRDEPEYVIQLVRAASLFYWCAYLVCALAVNLCASPLVHHWVHLKTLDAAAGAHALQVLGTATLLALPRAFYVSLLRGIQRVEFNNLIDVTTTALQQGGIVVILALGGNLFHVAAWLAVSFSLGLASYLVIVGYFFSYRALLPRYFPAVILRNRDYASQMAAISLLAMAQMHSDKVIVSRLLPLGAFGLYAFASGLVAKVSLITVAISQAAFPSLSSLFAARLYDQLLLQYRKLQDLTCYALLPVFALVPFFAVPLFSALVGAANARALLWPAALLALGSYLNATVNAPYVFSLAAGKPSIVARLNFYALFAVLPVTCVLTLFFGLTGAALSWVWYHVFYYLYGIPRICSQCLGIEAQEWYRHVGRVFVLAAMTYGVAGLVLAAQRAGTVVDLGLGYAAATLAFVSAAYGMIGEELRRRLQLAVRNLRFGAA
jgi:O-antigen/teichoic acid export membrane protein